MKYMFSSGSRKLKLFADRAFLPKGSNYVPLLYPFWGFIKEKSGSIDPDRFEDYAKIGRDLFEMVPLDEADALLFPSEWRTNCHEAQQMAELARKSGKTLIIFFNSDSDEEIPIAN